MEPQSTPLESYGLLSDCHSAALVSLDGSVDWWCLPRFDSPSVFAALLDPEGGRWRIAPTDDFESDQTWAEDTLVLTTSMTTASGRVEVTDALALTPGARGHDVGQSSPHTLLRVVEVTEGEIELDIEIRPRLEYGLTTPRWRYRDGHWRVWAGPVGLRLTTDVELEPSTGGALTGRVRRRQGQRLEFSLAYDPTYEHLSPLTLSPSEAVVETCRSWRSWAEQHTGYDGLYAAEVRRSSLILQGLTFQPSGAVVAAATTSLPEEVGGSLNWDYRFAWLRDVSLTMQALWVAACPDEADHFFHWLAGAIGELGDKPLQIAYRVDGQRDLTEHELDHLDGWRGSGPVRVGNDAWKQRQLDVLGEVLFAARLLRQQIEFPPETCELLRALAQQAHKDWRLPDAGMWESRGQPRHYTSSKVMCWVALDSAIDLAEDIQAQDQVEHWKASAEEIRDTVLREAWSDKEGFLAGALGSDQLDASILLLPLVGFLPATDPRMAATIEAVRRELSDGWLVYRWKGDSNAFLIVSFWLIECLALADRTDEAREGFETILALAGPAGLFSEEIRVKDRMMLGNLPQTFSHVGLINAAWRLSKAVSGQAQEPASGQAGSAPS